MAQERQEIDLHQAYNFARKAHEGQYRITGEPYINHCEAVAQIIYKEWGIKNNPQLIAAAFLHDTTEDTNVSALHISSQFGPEVAEMVGAVSKFPSQRKEDQDSDTLRKVVGLAYLDWRVSILKLADRLHNMRTMGSMPPEKAAAKGQETLNVYSRLAQSLGMWQVYKELQDLSFIYINPTGFNDVKELFAGDGRLDKDFIAHTMSHLAETLKQEGIKARVEYRLNSLYRFKEKLAKEVSLRRINDLISFRVIVDSEGKEGRDECYRLLGVLRHTPQFYSIEDESRFDDFIAFPRENGYKALQITLDDPKRGAVEVAIATKEMEGFNNWGVVSLVGRGEANLEKYLLKLVFSPTGEVRFLPREATGVDFAYSINGSLGASAEYLLIDGKEAPLSTVLPNGVRVDVVRGPERIAPDRALLDFALPTTKRKIEEQLNAQASESVRAKGKSMIEEILAPRGLVDLEDIEADIKTLLFHLGVHGSLPDLYFKVGAGAMSLPSLDKALTKAGVTKEKLGLTTVVIEGEDRPGILKDVASWVSDLGGNIAITKHGGEIGKFKLRLVVQNLPADSQKTLLGRFEGDARFTRSLVL